MKLFQPPPLARANNHQRNEKSGQKKAGSLPGKISQTKRDRSGGQIPVASRTNPYHLVKQPNSQHRQELTLRGVKGVLRPADIERHASVNKSGEQSDAPVEQTTAHHGD